MAIYLLVAAIKMVGCGATATVIGYIETFDEVVDQVITQSDQLGQSHLRLLVALRWHGDAEAHASPGGIRRFIALAGSSCVDLTA